MTTTTTRRAFTKGDAVTLLSDWDRKGTVRVAELAVYSCGAKQMILVEPGTEERFEGQNFRAVVGPQGDHPGTAEVYPRMTPERMYAVAIDKAERILAHERAHFARCMAHSNSDANYTRAMQKGLAELHEPRVVRYVAPRTVESFVLTTQAQS